MVNVHIDAAPVRVETGVRDAAQSLAHGIAAGANSLSTGAWVIGLGLGAGLVAVGVGIAVGQVLRKPIVIYAAGGPPGSPPSQNKRYPSRIEAESIRPEFKE